MNKLLCALSISSMILGSGIANAYKLQNGTGYTYVASTPWTVTVRGGYTSGDLSGSLTNNTAYGKYQYKDASVCRYSSANMTPTSSTVIRITGTSDSTGACSPKPSQPTICCYYRAGTSF